MTSQFYHLWKKKYKEYKLQTGGCVLKTSLFGQGGVFFSNVLDPSSDELNLGRFKTQTQTLCLFRTHYAFLESIPVYRNILTKLTKMMMMLQI